MKPSLTLAVCLLLAACGSNEAEDTAAAPADMAVATPAPDTVTPAAMAGTYEVTLPGGSVTMQTLSADGTYVDRMEGEVTERGGWRQQGDQLCYTPEGEAATEQCFAGGEPGPDGTFEIRDDAGDVSATVRKVETQPSA